MESTTPGGPPPQDDLATAFLGSRPHPGGGGEASVHLPRIPGYALERVLGQGGMGVVYLAVDLRLDRKVALKLVRFSDPVLAQRLLQEARAQAKVDHPHICKVYEAGEVDGTPYIAMQYLEGQRLDAAAALLSRDARVGLLRTIAEAMQAAHQQGLVHRDLKPANILVSEGPDGTPWPYVMDFGLARDSGAVRETQAGDVLGTPAYMAPEQARGDVAAIDRRTDVYALGVTLYELLVGRLPFEGRSGAQTLIQVLEEEPTPPSQLDPDLPVDLEAIVLTCLEKAPARRYDSARALAADLQAYLQGDPIAARRVGLLGRLGRKARRHRTITALLGLLVLASGVGTAALLRTRAQVAAAAELGRELGRKVSEAGAILRFGHLLPRHDLAREEEALRALRRDLEHRLPGLEGLPKATVHQALGQLDLLDGRTASALKHIDGARALGLRDEGLEIAWAEATLRRLEEAIFDALTSQSGQEQEKARQAAFQTYLRPVEAWLKGRDLPEIRLRIALALHRAEDAAREKAACLARAPWRYEVHHVVATAWRTRLMEAQGTGRWPEAWAALAASWSSLEEARALAPSDPALAEMAQELASRALEMRNSDPKLDLALWERRGEEALATQGILRPRAPGVRMAQAKHEAERLLARLDREAVPEAAFEGALATFTDLAQGEGSFQLEGAFLGATVLDVLAEERLNRNEDPGPLADRVMAVLAPALKANPTHPDLLVRKGFAHLYQGWHAARTGGNPEGNLAAAWDLTSEVLATRPDQMEALQVRCFTGALRGEWALRQGRDPGPDLVEARRCRERVATVTKTANALPLENAVLCLAEARRALAQGRPAKPSLDAARSCLATLKKQRYRAGMAAALQKDLDRLRSGRF